MSSVHLNQVRMITTVLILTFVVATGEWVTLNLHFSASHYSWPYLRLYLMTPAWLHIVACYDKLRNKWHSVEHSYTDSPRDSVWPSVSVLQWTSFKCDYTVNSTVTIIFFHYLKHLLQCCWWQWQCGIPLYTCFVVLSLVFLTWVFCLPISLSTTNDHHDKARHDSTWRQMSLTTTNSHRLADTSWRTIFACAFGIVRTGKCTISTIYK